MDALNDVKTKLGEHYRENPLRPPPKKKAKKGGDPEAFHEWIREFMKENGGKLSL